MKVNIYMYQTIRGPRRQQGYGVYILEAETDHGPMTKTYRIPIEGSRNEASLKCLYSALSHMNASSELTLYVESEWLATALTKWLPKWRRTEYLSARNRKVAFSDIWTKIGQMLETQELCVFCKEEHSYRGWLIKNAKPA